VIFVAGEALIDLLPVPGGEHRFDARPGGASFNVAVGLARLGRRTTFLGRISADTFGQLLRDDLKDAGVDLSMVVPAAEATTLGVTALDAHGKAAYSFYANGTADWQWTESEVPQVLPAGTQALYAGGLALRLLPGAAVLEGLMRRTRRHGEVLVFFDPNVRTGFGFTAALERTRVERQLRLAHVVKASEDDIALLYPGRDWREIATKWQHMTSGTVVVTLGVKGAYALTAGGFEITVPAVPVDVVDTVGAGDSFAAALLDGLVGEMPFDAGPAGLQQIPVDVARRLLERACVSAAFTCGRPGAESPDARTLEEAVQRAHQSQRGLVTTLESQSEPMHQQAGQ
jgi:fructokinase